MVSSYIPTLSALIKSRSAWRSVPRNQATGILAACRDATQLRQTPLDNVEHEIEVVSRSFEQASAQIVLSSSPNTTSQLLRDALAGKNAHIMHLACHGLQAENPLESAARAFMHSDGMLSIQVLMTMSLPDAVLAFLSACQTARGSERLPDQAVHLAASMLFCGFRSVVGTMW
jgi:CHAT domain-containing protein